MSTHNNSNEARASRAARTLTLTAAKSMTAAESINTDVVELAGQALTLLPACAGLVGVMLIVIDNTGSGTVICAAGYGAAGGSYDTVTMTDGDMAFFYCNGTYWDKLSYAVSA